MLEWGASFGPSVVFEGQVWRLLTSMFLHFGLIHLAMNLWCLLTTGPVVERFFGHLGFAALYVLSGLGGGCRPVRPSDLHVRGPRGRSSRSSARCSASSRSGTGSPPSILQPMRSGTLAFLGYNVLFGMASPRIDMAAHLGGPATGFVVGLVLADGRIAGPIAWDSCVGSWSSRCSRSGSFYSPGRRWTGPAIGLWRIPVSVPNSSLP